MRRLFELLAQYNAHVNAEMFRILRAVSPELLTRPAGSYYGTIMGLLNHLLVTDLGWLNGTMLRRLDGT